MQHPLRCAAPLWLATVALFACRVPAASNAPEIPLLAPTVAAPLGRDAPVLSGFREVRGYRCVWYVPSTWRDAEGGREAEKGVLRGPIGDDGWAQSAEVSSKPFDGTMLIWKTRSGNSPSAPARSTGRT